MLHTLLPDLISHYVAAGWFVYAYQSIKFPVLCPYPRCFQLPFMTGLFHCFMETGYSHIQWFHHIFKTLTMTMWINIVWYFTGVLLVPSVTYWLSLAFKLATGLGLFSKLKPMKKPWFYQFQFWEVYFYPSKNAWFSPCSNSKKFSLFVSGKYFRRSLLLPGVFVSLGNIVICLLQVLKPTKYKITLNICFVKSFHCMYDMTYCCLK